MNRRELLLSGMALVGGAVIPGASVASAQVTNNHLIANISPEPNALAVVQSLPVAVVAANINDGLVTYDDNLKPVPELAESWETSEDGLTVTFHLRKNANWHDGKPFTSADVEYSIRNILLYNPIGASTFAALETVETPDPKTVVLKFKTPAPVIWSYLSGGQLPLVPKHLYDGQQPLTNPRNNEPVGTGPFRFVEWARGRHIILERNPDYWDKSRPLLDRVTFKIITDGAAREAALRTNEIQYAGASAVSLATAARLRDTSKNLVVDTKGWDALVKVFFFDFNLKRPQFQDVRVRRAFAHAIDRKLLADLVFHGFAKPSHGPIPQSQRFYNPNIPDYEFNPAKAEALLDEAGFRRGAGGVRLRINHVNHSFGDEYKLAGDLFKQQLKAIGVEVELINYDTATQLRKLYTERDFDTMSCDYAPYADPQIGVVRRYWSKAIKDGVPWSNATQYADPKTDAVIEAIAREADPKRQEYIDELQRIAQTDLPSISLVAISIIRVYSAKLEGVNVTPVGASASLKDVRFKA